MRMALTGADAIRAPSPPNCAYSARNRIREWAWAGTTVRAGTLGGALTEVSSEGQRLREVEEAFASLPERYLGADHAFSASYRIELDDLGLSWAVELDQHTCRVTVSPERDPDVVIGTDAETWLELREGRLSGLDACRSRLVWA